MTSWSATCAGLCVLVSGFSASAAEPAGWTQMKAACRASGGSASDYYETWKTQGCICGGVATRQRTCSSGTSAPPEWIPGRAHPQYPHVFAAQARDRWSAEDGYNFVRPGTGDLTVVWA